jgi:hypothetical protein
LIDVICLGKLHPPMITWRRMVLSRCPSRATARSECTNSGQRLSCQRPLWVAESDKRYVFHLVAKRFSLDEGRSDGFQKNKLVLIGRNLDRSRPRRQLEACLCRRALPRVDRQAHAIHCPGTPRYFAEFDKRVELCGAKGTCSFFQQGATTGS